MRFKNLNTVVILTAARLLEKFTEFSEWKLMIKLSLVFLSRQKFSQRVSLYMTDVLESRIYGNTIGNLKIISLCIFIINNIDI